MSSPVNYQFADGIARITMDDGKANVMGLAMIQALESAFDQAEKDRAVTLLAGRPGMFSGGFDLAVFKRDKQELLEMLTAGARLAERLFAFPYPLVTVATGHAVAMGAFMLLTGDVRLGPDQDARFHVNEVQVGLPVPRGFAEICRYRLTPSALDRAAVTARPFNPQEAAQAGFIHECVPPTELENRALERAGELRKLDAAAFTATKQRLRTPAMTAVAEGVRQDVTEWQTMFGGQ